MADNQLRELLRERMTQLAQVHDTTPEAAKLSEALKALDEVERREIAARPDPKTCRHIVSTPLHGDTTRAECTLCKTQSHVANFLAIITSQRDTALKEVDHWKKEAGCGS